MSSESYKHRCATALLVCAVFALNGCAESADHVSSAETSASIDTISFSKADIYEFQNDDGAVHPLVWRDAARCAAGLGGGAWEGATDLLETLWHLPGVVAKLALKVGREIAQREVDQILALTNEEARQRVRETANRDLQNIRNLFATIRDAIPTLWGALETGTEWFGELEREEKVFLVCRITGRLAFEIVAIIAADKGLGALSKLARIRLIQNVDRNARTISRVASWLSVGRRTVLAVGVEIAGRRRALNEDPRADFHGLGTLADYKQDWTDNIALSSPALGWVDDTDGRVEVLSNEASWESTPTYGWIDMLIPSHQTPPSRAILMDEDIGPELAEVAALWADPMADGWDQRVKEVLDRGAEFDRYLVPADWAKVSLLNPLLMTISGQIAQLSEQLGHDVGAALEQVAEYVDRSPLEKITFLDDVFAELATSEMRSDISAESP